jgi:hypothetical protein
VALRAHLTMGLLFRSACTTALIVHYTPKPSIKYIFLFTDGGKNGLKCVGRSIQCYRIYSWGGRFDSSRVGLIQPSAKKGHSAKYVPQQWRFWSEASLLALLFLCTSRGTKGGLQFSE